MKNVQISKALIQRDIRIIRPSCINENFTSLPLYHPIEITKRRTVKNEVITNTSYTVEPVLIINNGIETKRKILECSTDKQNQIKMQDTIYIIKGTPSHLNTAPSPEISNHSDYNVNVSDILDNTKSYIENYVDFQEHNEILPKLISLYILGTYIYDAYPAYPYIWLHGERECGKTRLLYIISLLSYYGMFVTKISAAALYRTVEGSGATVCIDEAEKLWARGKDGKEVGDADLIQMLNAGYKRGGQAFLVDKTTMNVEGFKVYSPKVMASIKAIEPTIEDRAILIIMRKTKHSTITKRTIREEVARPIRNEFYKMRLKYGSEIYSEYLDIDKNEMGTEMNLQARDFEVFMPLLYICEKFKPEWLEDLKKYIIEYENIKKNLSEMTFEATIMLSLFHIIAGKYDIEERGGVAGWNGAISIGDICEKIAFIDSDRKDVKAGSVGWALKRIGFRKVKKIGGKKYRVINGKIVMDYLEAHNIDYPIESTMQKEPLETDITTYTIPDGKRGGIDDDQNDY